MTEPDEYHEYQLELIGLELNERTSLFMIEVNGDRPIIHQGRPLLFWNETNLDEKVDQMLTLADGDQETSDQDLELTPEYCAFPLGFVLEELKTGSSVSSSDTLTCLNCLIDILLTIPEVDRESCMMRTLQHCAIYFTYNSEYDALFDTPMVNREPQVPDPLEYREYMVPINFFPEGTVLTRDDLISAIYQALGMITLYGEFVE